MNKLIGGGWFVLSLGSVAIAASLIIPSCATYEPITPIGKTAKGWIDACRAAPSCQERRHRAVRAARIAKVLVCAETGGGVCAALSAASLVQRARLAHQRVLSAANDVNESDREIAQAIHDLKPAEIAGAAEAVVTDN